MPTANWSRLIVTMMPALVLCACGARTAPEEAIRAWVDRGHVAAEEKDRGTLLDMVSPAYADARGNDRDDLSNMLRLIFLRQNKIALILRIDEIDVIDETAAELALQVGMAGMDGSLLGFDADAYRFEMDLVNDGDGWQLIAARWGELGGKLR